MSSPNLIAFGFFNSISYCDAFTAHKDARSSPPGGPRRGTSLANGTTEIEARYSNENPIQVVETIAPKTSHLCIAGARTTVEEFSGISSFTLNSPTDFKT